MSAAQMIVLIAVIGFLAAVGLVVMVAFAAASSDRERRAQEQKESTLATNPRPDPDQEPDGSLSDREQLVELLGIIHREVGNRLSTQLPEVRLLKEIASTRRDLGGERHLRGQLQELQAQGLIKFKVTQRAKAATKERLAVPQKRAVQITKLGREHARSNRLATDPRIPKSQGPRQITIRDSPGATVAGNTAYGGYIAGDSVGGHKIVGDNNAIGGWTEENVCDLLRLVSKLTPHLEELSDEGVRQDALVEQRLLQEAIEDKNISRVGARLAALRSLAMDTVPDALWDGMKATFELIRSAT